MTRLWYLIPIWIVICTIIVAVSAVDTNIPQPANYGNGVLYFPKYTNINGGLNPAVETFGPSLANYLSQNTNQTVVSIIADAGGYGTTTGYYVIVKSKTTLQCLGTNGYGQCYNYALVDA